MPRPLLVGVGGAHSGSGKTTVAAALLSFFSSGTDAEDPSSAYPILRSLKRWGAVKCTKTAIYTSLIDDGDVLRTRDKDTARFCEAGAEEVLWVQSPPENLEEVLPEAVDRLSHLDAIIVEGNSAIEFLKPDIVLFIVSASNRIKSSAQGILHQADIIIISGDHDSYVADEGVTACTVSFTPSDNKALREIARRMEMTIQKRKIEELLKERSVEGGIPCARARGIADELGVPYKAVGEAADTLKIKIKNCEFGCF